MAAALLSWLLPSAWRRLWLPCRPRLLLACLEIYLILSLNLVGVFAEGLPGRKTIKVSLNEYGMPGHDDRASNAMHLSAR